MCAGECNMRHEKHSNKRKAVTVLGSTGSIGCSTLDVISLNTDRFFVHGLVALHNVDGMFNQILRCLPNRVAMFDLRAADHLRAICADALGSCASELTLSQKECLKKLEISGGAEGVCDLAGDGAADIVMGAVVGGAGLRPLMSALKSGVTVCLANKEALVMSGRLFFDTAERFGSVILPVDSEHSAIFQCLPEDQKSVIGRCDLKGSGIDRIILTGSGGPCRDLPLSKFAGVTPEFAVNHPVWSMGPKISVDSATMMNKALEFIEARYLFNAAPEEVEVIIHPQSVIHSMVSYTDGAVLAQLGQPDMKTPIAAALAFPERIAAGVDRLDFRKIGSLTFKEPEKDRYPCLFAGIEASIAGQAATTALNAANEVAVASFLDHNLSFTGIADTVKSVLDRLGSERAYTLEEIENVDERARRAAAAYIAGLHV